MSDELFERLADAVRPDSPVIRDITADNKKFGIVVTCEVENGGRPYKVYHLNPHDVADWIEDERPEWLEAVTDKPDAVTGEHVQTIWTVTADDYVSYHMTDEDWHDYLKSNNYTDLPYERD